MVASGAQLCGYISILCYTHLNLAFLFHKTVLVMFLLYSTVNRSTFCNFFEQDRFCDVHDEGRQAGNHDKNTQIHIIMLPLRGKHST